MTLIKTSFLSAIAVMIKMITLLSLNKILAIYVGPSGYAALGQFQNAIQMITTLASGAINTGVTKYTAEYHKDEIKQRAVWRTAGTISSLGSVLMAVGIIIFNKPLALWFLKDDGLGNVFIWFAITLILFVFNTLLLAILNGKKEIRRFVIANISGSLFALAVTSLMAIIMGLYGALIAVAIYPSLAFFVTALLCYRARWFRFEYLFGGVDKDAVKKLSKFTAMAATSAVCLPVSHILVRNYLGENLGWEAAGYWEAMWRLSAAYLLLVTTTLGVYYLPRLSELQDSEIIKQEIVGGYKIILPAAAASGLAIYLMRESIIRTLFTADFAAMEVLFGWQMIGDTMKIGSWILAYLMLSKAMTKLFILSEIAAAISFYLLTIFLTDNYGLEGVAMAHSINYVLYWLLMACFIGNKIFSKSNAR